MAAVPHLDLVHNILEHAVLDWSENILLFEFAMRTLLLIGLVSQDRDVALFFFGVLHRLDTHPADDFEALGAFEGVQRRLVAQDALDSLINNMVHARLIILFVAVYMLSLDSFHLNPL